MPKEHRARPGDHVTRIGAIHGIQPYHPIWDDASNAALRKQRVNPNILSPGDLLTIPDPVERVVDRSTEQRHRFKVHSRPLVLRLVLRRWDGTPKGGKAVTLDLDRTKTQDTTSKAGQLERTLLPTAERGTLIIDSDELDLLVGHLEPVDTMPGLLQRLENLGYAPGNSSDPKDLTVRSAIEEFQCDHGLTVDGVAGKVTLGKLVQAYGC